MPNHSSLFDLTHKIAVVTGASYGLGVTFAETLAQAGAKVALAARSTEKLASVAEKIAREGGTAAAFSCDVSDAAQVVKLREDIEHKWGIVDILVNNAGIAADGGPVPEKVPHEAFIKTIEVNLFGTWYCCREFGAAMLRRGRGGSIINIASIAGLDGWRDAAPAYQASKAAGINLTRNLACSWGDRNVRVNAIAPGWFPSELTAPLFALGGFEKSMAATTPMRRLGRPEELAAPLLFLASEASSFVTGSVLVVDGGFSASSGDFPYPEAARDNLAKILPNDLGKHIRADT
jgi:NAD(P)-dependent dehydrogenase (short-subunit alcohol dehydrogenase family)